MPGNGTLTLGERIAKVLGEAPVDIEALSGGCIGEVYAIRLRDGEQRVVKVDDGVQPRLDVEGYMLQYLAEHTELPVPRVYNAAPHLLIMDYVPGESRFTAVAERHAAELLAAVHNVSGPAFGLARDTLIGGLHQPNPWTERWLDFFAEQRLLYMAREAEEAGRLPPSVRRRVTNLCGALDQWLLEPPTPSLIHGDVWTTNVLASENRITAFLDPAIYYAHAEVELSFITLFGTFGTAFFERYQELKTIDAGFFEVRHDLYNLYPLLVHVRLFGGTYVHSVTQILARFGF